MNLNSRTVRHLLATIAATFLLLQPGGAAAAPKVTYDLNADWSTTQNPNGVWSYNHNATPISAFQPFWWGESGWGYLWIGDGVIIKGSQPAVNDPWGTPPYPYHDWQPGDVMLHALSIPYGGETTFVNVTWTSPDDGTIDITGRAWEGEILSDRDVSWSLIVAGNIVAQRSSVQGLFRTDPEADFAANAVGKNSLKHIRVNQGDVVEFRVVTGTYYGQFVGLQAKITLRPR